MDATVLAVSCSATHSLAKTNEVCIKLLEALGVEGDAHLGATVKHRSRVLRDPSQPNPRQVHLIHAELFEELRAAGFSVDAGRMGENITTRGIDLLGLPTGARLHLGPVAVVEVTECSLLRPQQWVTTTERATWASAARRNDWVLGDGPVGCSAIVGPSLVSSA